jgi:biotin transport system substrate-specific component
MLRTLSLKDHAWIRITGIAVFTLLTVSAARVSVEIGTPVPFTLQVLAILLSGMVLGARDGALSQLAYLSLIAMNFPVDSRMLGIAAFAGPTAGFLVGFPVLAYVTGTLAERGANRLWVRWLAGIFGVAVLYLFGATWLKLAASLDWTTAYSAAVAPFILMDMAKAIIAAALTEGGRTLLLRSNLTQ